MGAPAAGQRHRFALAAHRDLVGVPGDVQVEADAESGVAPLQRDAGVQHGAGAVRGGLGAELADRLGQGDRSWYARLPTIAWLITAPMFAVGLLAPNLWVAWPLLLIPNALNILWLGPVTTAVQHLVPQPLRSTASASFLLINNLIGLGVGPTLIGALSELFKERFGTEALRYAAVSVVGFYLVAAFLMFFAIKRLRADWVEDSVASQTVS